MRRECWTCALENSTNAYLKGQLNINVYYTFPRSFMKCRYTSVSIRAIDDDNLLARICKARTRWECNGKRIDEIKRPRGVDRKVERGPLSPRDGGVESRRGKTREAGKLQMV